MGQGNPPLFPVKGADGGEDFLSRQEAVLWVGDTGNGDMFNRKHGHNAAANVYKGPEWLQPGNASGQQISRGQGSQEVVHDFFLCGAAGKPDQRRALFIGFHALDRKAGGLADSGKHGDIPVRAADPGGDGFLTGHNAGDTIQGKVERMGSVTAEGGGFQDISLFHGRPEFREGEGAGRPKTLRREEFVFRHKHRILS